MKVATRAWALGAALTFLGFGVADSSPAMAAGGAVGWAGDPVDTLYGEYTHAEADLPVVASDGARFVFSRNYDSETNINTTLGPGWRYNFEVSLTHDTVQSPNDIGLVEPDGALGLYTSAGNGDFNPPPGDQRTLHLNDDGTYTSTDADGSTWNFNRNGQLTNVSEKSGRHFTLAYNSKSQVSSIGDPGQAGSITFAYDTCFPGRLCSASDSDNPPGDIRYSYTTQGQLASVTDREGAVTKYSYSANQQLSSIQDANGHLATTLAYDGQLRVASQTDARGLVSGAITTFSYVTNPDQSVSTTVTYPPSSYFPDTPAVSTWAYDRQQRLATAAWTQPGPADEPLVDTYTYGDPKEQPTCVWSGGQTPPPPDGAVPVQLPMSSGLISPLSFHAAYCPLGAGQYVVADSTRAFALLQPYLGSQPTQVSLLVAQQGATNLKLDNLGRLASFEAGPAASTDAGTWTLSYDRDDRMRFIKRPNGSSTEFRFDPVGNLVAIVAPDGGTDAFQYDERDSLVQAHTASGFAAQFGYDEGENLTHVLLTAADGTVVTADDYAYDGLARLRRGTHYPQWSASDGAIVTEYSYDSQGRPHGYVPAG